jgi:Protein of unknown function (DUF4058)
MPLLDHFHPPLLELRDWHSFHNLWASAIAGDLNERLPAEYFAEANVQYGIEIDVAVLEEPEGGEPPPNPVVSWSPPAATLSVPYTIASDVAEVRVYRQLGGKTLVGAIELVSPSNKDRPSAKSAFVSKCDAILQGGSGVMIVDVVTLYPGTNLHDELMTHTGSADATWGERLYAVSYRPLGANGSGRLDIWREPLVIGSGLPTLPLCLLNGPVLRIDLEESYQYCCRRSKFPARLGWQTPHVNGA